MEDLFNIIEKIFPILIFIFWIVISIIAGNRKKLKRQPAPPPQSTSIKTNPPRQRQESQQTTLMHEREKNSVSLPKHIQVADDLKRKLESVFGELTFNSETNNEEYASSTQKKASYIPEAVAENVPLETVPLETHRNLRDRNRAENKKADDLIQQSIYGEAVYEPSRMESELNISIEGLRNAVIWSEIIAPPLSLRNE